MSQPTHRRRAGLAVATLVAGTPLFAAGVAYAEPVDSGREVVFDGGGLLGVSCAAKANRSSVTVPAESTLRVLNQTGHRATLVLDGRARGEIAENSTAEVLFHRGPVRLGLKPHCVLPKESAVRVQVTQAPPATSAPPPATPSGPSTGGSGVHRTGGHPVVRAKPARRRAVGATTLPRNRWGRSSRSPTRV